MNTEILTKTDLERRIQARRAMEGQRRRVRCKRCRKQIPEERRSVAVYCSPACHNSHRWEVQTALRAEIRDTVRSMQPSACECGAPLSLRGKSGRIARSCKQCRDRKAQKRYRARNRGVSVAWGGEA